MPNKASKTTTNSIKQTRLYHRRYLIAINSPIRREILRVLRKNTASIEELQKVTRLDKDTLEWHLSILEHGFCIQKTYEQKILKYKLTQEGKIVNFIR